MKPIALTHSALTGSTHTGALIRLAMAASIVGAFLYTAVPVHAQHAQDAVAQPVAQVQVDQASAAQRDLWVGHIFWVRNVVIDTFAGNKQAAAVAENEVVANAKAIAASIEPFYGKEVSDKLFVLLTGHYGAIKEHLEATAAGSKAKQGAAVRKLTGNATEIATFLSGANPYLPFQTLNGLLLAHGGHHIQQNEQLKAKQYVEEAQTWDAMKKHMYVIADALAGAIAKQFTDKLSWRHKVAHRVAGAL